jgi:FixJ family two-component response regulator
MASRLFTVVVDDDLSVCRAIRRLLQSAGMRVETNISAESYLQTHLEREPDCLILDIRMPGMSGPQLRDRIRDLGYLTPVVFITAYAADERGLEGMEEEVLRKPFGDQVLIDAIHRAVNRRGT